VLGLYVLCNSCTFPALKTNLKGQKHYSKQTVYDAHLSSKKHIKAASKQASSDKPPTEPNGNGGAASRPIANHSQQSSAKLRLRNAALFTNLTTSLLTTLLPALTETKSNVERRFSLTAREREQELLEKPKPATVPTNPAADGGVGEEEEEEERIYNPLKLPLGWDGKPIPYWLYKLHGLGVAYRCEICSDQVYMGRFVSVRPSSSIYTDDLLSGKISNDTSKYVSLLTSSSSR
jgi:splicing factor 3A subunit 3